MAAADDPDRDRNHRRRSLMPKPSRTRRHPAQRTRGAQLALREDDQYPALAQRLQGLPWPLGGDDPH